MGEVTDLERVGLFIDGPYDTDVTLFRPDIKTLMGRDNTDIDDEKRLAGPWIPSSGHKLKAATNDWTFAERFLSLWEDVPYEDPGEWRRRYEREKAEGNISDSPFISTVGEKTMNGLGTYYGTFITEMEAFSPEVRDKVEENEEYKGLPNFLTNPGKKGSGYGYNDICFSPYPEHEDDPYFDQLEAKQTMREEHEEAQAKISDSPFIPAGPPKEYFDPNPFFDSKDPDGETETYDFDRNAKGEGEDDLLAGPFLPSSFTKKINGNKDVMLPFEKFPEYDPSDPWEPVPVNQFRQSNKDEDEDKLPWKPQFGNRTRQIRSVLHYSIIHRINGSNFHMW